MSAEPSDTEFFNGVAAELQRLRDHVARRLDANRIHKASKSNGELLRYTLRQAYNMAVEIAKAGDPQ